MQHHLITRNVVRGEIVREECHEIFFAGRETQHADLGCDDLNLFLGERAHNRVRPTRTICFRIPLFACAQTQNQQK